jgi:hypothetical protein
MGNNVSLSLFVIGLACNIVLLGLNLILRSLPIVKGKDVGTLKNMGEYSIKASYGSLGIGVFFLVIGILGRIFNISVLPITWIQAGVLLLVAFAILFTFGKVNTTTKDNDLKTLGGNINRAAKVLVAIGVVLVIVALSFALLGK